MSIEIYLKIVKIFLKIERKMHIKESKVFEEEQRKYLHKENRMEMKVRIALINMSSLGLASRLVLVHF